MKWPSGGVAKWVLALSLCPFATSPLYSQAAFVGCEGAGCVTAAGRNGTILFVTNTNDSGAGSLRAALETSGTRTIICRVAGTIAISSSLDEITVDDPFYTFAGQTCPGGGLTVDGRNSSGYGIRIATNNGVIQYLSVRMGLGVRSPGCQCGSNIWIGHSNTHNLVFDHLSMSWTTDETATIWNGNGATPKPHDITFSWIINSEGIAGHATGMAVGSTTNTDDMDNIDVHHSLWGWGSHRFPHHSNHKWRWVNNITYNYGFRAYQCDDGCEIDWISNIYKAGPATDASIYEMSVDPDLLSNNASGIPSIYATGNKGPHQSDYTASSWPMIREIEGFNGPYVGALSEGTYGRGSPLAALTYPITATPANQLEDLLFSHVGNSRRLSCAGEWEMRRDAVDARLIQEYEDGTGISTSGVDPDETAVGGFPTIGSGTACTDTDNDGLPDEYEDNNGLNKNSAADGWGTVTGGACDSYTNLDCFLAGLQLSGDSKPITGKGRGIPQ